jgi:hypothetical protein
VTEIQLLVDDLAARLGQPVQLDDRRFRALASSSHPDEIDAVRRTSILGRQAPEAVTRWLEGLGVLTSDDVVHVPANPRFGMVARACLPVRFHNRLLGLLWLMEHDRRLSDQELSLCRDCARDLAEELLRLELDRDEERREEALSVRRLLRLDDGLATVPRLEREQSYGVLIAEGFLQAGAPAAGLEARLLEAADRIRRSLPSRHHLSAIDDRRATLIVAAAGQAALNRAAELLLDAAQGAFGDLQDVEAGVACSEAVSTLDALPEAHRHAELASRLGRTMPALGPLVRWPDLGPLRLLGELLGDRNPGDFLPSSLRSLLAQPDGEALVATLEAYLEHGGDAAAAAAQLFLHRSSLYKRLHRIEDLAGVDLRSGSDRLELHLGVRLWRMANTAATLEAAV